jgi:3-hydroxyacyl-[acyl-carrier-protein] dehydratase
MLVYRAIPAVRWQFKLTTHPGRLPEFRTVPNRDLIIDPSTIDFSRIVADIDEIRRYNSQRFELEQLTAIVHEDHINHICVAYKDITDREFWVRGHMPGMPLMPGVVMCEAAAQVCSYHTQKYNLLGDNTIVGFGGLDEVRFRDTVRVGDRLVLMCKLLKLRRNAMVVSQFQGVVGEQLVVEGQMIGVPLPVDALKKLQDASAR